jgi:hypothetical protein
MLADLPEGWPRIDDAAMAHARAQGHAALQDTARTVRHLAAYYRREGNYAGATFTELRPNDPHAFVASDLLAVTMLSVEVRRWPCAGSWNRRLPLRN